MDDKLTWWRVSRRRIEPITADRFTETSVWIKGRRNARITQWERYYPSFAEAKQSLVDEAEARVKELRRQLEQANGALGNAKGLKEPAHD